MWYTVYIGWCTQVYISHRIASLAFLPEHHLGHFGEEHEEAQNIHDEFHIHEENFKKKSNARQAKSRPTSPKSPKSPNIYAIKSIQNDTDELDIDQVGALLLGMSYSDKNSPKSSKKKRKSKKKKSPRNSLNKNGPDIISSPSNVYKLGPIVGMDRQNESASILHRAHNNGVGRNFSSEEDFVVQLSGDHFWFT